MAIVEHLGGPEVPGERHRLRECIPGGECPEERRS